MSYELFGLFVTEIKHIPKDLCECPQSYTQSPQLEKSKIKHFLKVDLYNINWLTVYFNKYTNITYNIKKIIIYI